MTILDDKTRTTYASMTALAALKHYALVFPDDVVPFRCVAFLLASEHDDARMAQHRNDMEERRNRLALLVSEFSLKGGALLAAYEATLSVLSAMHLDGSDEARTHLQLAKHAMERGVLSG